MKSRRRHPVASARSRTRSPASRSPRAVIDVFVAPDGSVRVRTTPAANGSWMETPSSRTREVLDHAGGHALGGVVHEVVTHWLVKLVIPLLVMLGLHLTGRPAS